MVWKVNINRREQKRYLRLVPQGPTPCSLFNNVDRILSLVKLVHLPEGNIRLVKTLVGLPRTNREGRKELSIVGRIEDQIAIAD